MTKKPIAPFQGSKGPKSPPQPTRTPDTLRSEDFVEAILAISEGPIEGLQNGLKSVYIGDTPLQNEDGSKNFDIFNVNIRPGLPVVEADILRSYLGGISSNLNVNTTLAYAVPVVRQLTLQNVNAIDLRFAVNQLYIQGDAGVFEADLRLAIYLKRSDEPTWRPAYNPTAPNEAIILHGKTTSTYVKEMRIPVYEQGDFYWQVKVTKYTEETNADHAADVIWESIQQVFNEGNKYADTATMQIYGRASNQFSSIPEFTGVFKGIKCSVPSNYNPVTRVYTGVWNGTFVKAWTNNPAWILYDFVMNDRYGMSAVTQLNMDKYEVYEVGQFCDELVSDGAGGEEPRYTFNARIQTPRSAIEQARFIAGSMGAVIFDDQNGNIFLRVDRNEDAKHIFTLENISEEGFSYEYTDVTSRYNDLTVSFINPLTNWEEDRRRIFDQTSIDKFGQIPFDFVAVGCTSESEALRRAYYKMNTALTETMMVSFTTNRLGLDVKPFDIILISDVDLGYSLSGRIKSLNLARTVITLRDALYLEAGVAYIGHFRTPDGVITRTVTSATTGAVTTFNVSSALPSNTPEYCTFILEEAPGEGIGAPKPFRVIKVEESDGNPDQIKISAHEINRNKFADSEALVVSDPTNYSGVGDPSNIPGPTNVVFRDFYQRESNEVWTVVTPTFNHAAYRYYNGEFEVYSRPVVSGEPVGSFVPRILHYGDTLINHPPGLHQFIILPINTFGQKPPLAKMTVWTFTVGSANTIGTPPKAVTNVTILPSPRGFVVDWDIEEGEAAHIHHFLIKEGEDENTAVTLVDNLKETFYHIDPMTKRSYTLWIYAVSLAFVPSVAVSASYENLAPAAPSNIKIEVAFETVAVYFDRNSEVDIIGYRIQIRQIGTTAWLDMDPSGLIENIQPDTAYEVQVAAQDALTLILGDEVWSVPRSFRTRDTQGVEKGFDEVRQSTAVNLLRNGSFEKGLANWTIFPGSVVTVEDDPNAPYADPLNATSKILKLGNGVIAINQLVSDKVVVRPLLPYTLSFDALQFLGDPGENHYFTLNVYNSVNALVKTFALAEGKLIIDPEELSPTVWRRFNTTFTMPENAVWAEVVLVSQGAGVIYLDGVQLQKGSVATLFNPHVSEELSPSDLGLITNPDSTPPGVPTALTANGAFKNITLAWTSPGDSDIGRFEILGNTSNNSATAQLIGSSVAPVFSWPAPLTNVLYYFWVRAVDTTGNVGGLSSVASATTIPLSAADFQNLSIVNAMIANATIDDAKIANLSVSKLTAGTISAAQVNIGNDRMRLEGLENRLRVLDETGVERIRLGRIAAGAQNYGLEVRDFTGKLILGVTGLGVNVVGSGQLIDGSVSSNHITANAILADKIAVGAITASKIAASAIVAAAIAAGAVTADKISVAALSAIAANLGTVTAGILQGAGLSATANFWNLNTGEFKIGPASGAQYIWFDPVQGKIFIKGEVEFQGADVSWQDIINKPQSLAEISAAEASKLAGIAAGADVTSANTAANVLNVGPALATDVAYWANDPAVRVNQQSTTINGAKITTGSIVANKLSVASLSSITANIGTITAGLLRNSTGSAIIDLSATGTAQFININNKFIVQADGFFAATSGVISGDLLVAGTVTANKIIANGITEVFVGVNSLTLTASGDEKFLVMIDLYSGSVPSDIHPRDTLSVSTQTGDTYAGGPGLSPRFWESAVDKIVPELVLNQYNAPAIMKQGNWHLRNNSGVIYLGAGTHTLNVYRYVAAVNYWYKLATYPGQGQCKMTVLKIKR